MAALLLSAVCTVSLAFARNPHSLRIGRAPAHPSGSRVVGSLAGSTRLSTRVTLQPQNGLADYAQAVSTPGSPEYHKYLSVTEFRKRFGASPSTVASVEAALAADGLSPGAVSANGLSIPVTATASKLGSAFQTSFQRVQLRSGRVAYANTSAPALPSSVGSAVQGVVGLNSLYVSQPLGESVPRPLRGSGVGTGRRGAAGARAHALVHSSAGGNPSNSCWSDANANSGGAWNADQIASAYDLDSFYTSGDGGQGQTIALFEQEPNLKSDISEYAYCYGLTGSPTATVPNVSYYTVDGGAGTGAGSGEAALDIEQILGLAPQAQIDVFQAPVDASDAQTLDEYTAMVDTPGVTIISTSWGLCEPENGSSMAQSENTLFEQAAAEGISVFAASGDSGSTDCYKVNGSDTPAVDDPASQPYVTGTGGTSLPQDSAASQTVWNNSTGAGGGGISTVGSMPTWQANASAALNVLNANSTGSGCGAGAGHFCREVPDVSGDADPDTGYAIYLTRSGDPQWLSVAGTSAVAPLWAAYTALVNASSSCNGHAIGFANPLLYEAADSDYAANFTDVTSGNNDLTADGYSGGLYPAGTGYDMASGLGTPIGAALGQTLCAESDVVTLTNPGEQSGAAGTPGVSLAMTSSDAQGNQLSFTVSGLPTGLTISSQTGTITGSLPSNPGAYTVTVTATSPNGASASQTFAWLVGSQSGVAPVITGIVPATAAPGTTVTISGADLTGTQTVDFGTTPATDVTVNSDTQLTAVVPAGSGTVHVTAANGSGTSTATSADLFTYTPAPTVHSLLTTAGPQSGGTSVTITGANFSHATAVKFGTTAAGSFQVVGDNEITATAPAGSGTRDVTVTTPSGTSATSSADQFTYVAPPAVTAIYPTSGPLAGGTSVTITGTSLTGATAVDFGSTAAASFTVVNSTTITATAPAGSAGAVDITVTTAYGTSPTSGADQYTYAAGSVPTVTGVSPSSGSTVGGTSVTITGTNLTNATAVEFGAAAASSVTVVSSTRITATAPAGSTGTVDVRVTTPFGTSATSSADHFTYAPPPSVSAVDPGSGPLAGGTSVTITGTNFAGATAVKFGSAAATSFTVLSNTTITATAPAGAAGTVDVTVTNPYGTSTTSSADQFTYVPAPAITGVSPSVGPPTGFSPGDSSVTITGTNFTGATAVQFGSAAANSFTVVNSTTITATAPAGTGTVNVMVTTPDGTSATSSADQYTYAAGSAPAVTAVSPGSGPAAGGTSVTITGTGFTNATAVTFGSTAATSFTVVNSTTVTATAPAGAGTADVTVTTPYGTSTTSTADQFGYGPAVTSVSPGSGVAAGGTVVTITGSSFTGATAVRFGSTAATSYTVVSSTQITATAPAGTGTVDVTVVTPNGPSPTSGADLFSYGPTVTSISPNDGPTAGGTTVTITGSNLTGASAVTFGSGAATSFTAVSSTQITATAPAGTAGTVDVTVTTAGGTSASSTADQYTYVAPPAVASISPNSGPPAGGTTVTITGTNLSGATTVTFGSVAASSFTVVSGTKITATAPAESAGTVAVSVTTPDGTSATSSADQFTYAPVPTVTAISPNSGPLTGGTSVTITGTGFTGATTVKFGGTVATSFQIVSGTKITATAPAEAAATVDVSVGIAGEISATSTADQFTYVPVPAVTGISPGSGPAAGGTSVTVTGTNLTGATAIRFGSTAAASFQVLSATRITATAPAGAGTVDVTVTTAGGTSATSAAARFSYGPTVSAIGPSSGPAAGGTTVTITGANFAGGATVAFGGAAASSVQVLSGTTITATAPAGTGTVDVTVTTPYGTSPTSAADRFVYAPAVTSISPSSGPAAGGTTVTITGTGLTGATAVDFGGAGATSFQVVSSTRITATAPAGTGTVDVTVTTPGGASLASAADQFTYVAPTVTTQPDTSTSGGSTPTPTPTPTTSTPTTTTQAPPATTTHTSPTTPTTTTATSPTTTPSKPARPKPATTTLSTRYGDQVVKLVVPATSLCTAARKTYSVSFSSRAGKGTPKLRFRKIEYYIDKGVARTGRKLETVHGKRKQVKITTYVPNATSTKASGTTRLRLTRLKSGSHTLKAIVTYAEKVKGKTATHSKTLRTKLRVCAS